MRHDFAGLEQAVFWLHVVFAAVLPGYLIRGEGSQPLGWLVDDAGAADVHDRISCGLSGSSADATSGRKVGCAAVARKRDCHKRIAFRVNVAP